MKAKLQAKIVGIDRNATFEGDHNVFSVPGLTKLNIVASHGKVDTHLNNAQFAAMDGDLFLKGIIASDIKIGATITITVSDEEVED